MALSDLVYLMAGAFILIIVVLSMDYAFTQVMSSIEPDLPAERFASLNESWTNNATMMNDSFSALFVVFGLVSLALAIFLPSHPVFLVVWILLNLVMIWVYDTMELFLQAFLDSDLDTGIMDDATSFVDTTLPKAALVLNMLIGTVLFGKRVMTG